MASNVVNITDATRQSHQYSATVDGLLKNVYMNALNNTTFHATPLMEMFGDFGGTIDFAGNKIIKAFKHRGAGGFGGISEGGDFVKGRKQKGFQGSTRIKQLNAYFSLTGPASRTVRQGEGAYVDAVSSAMDDTLKLARQQMERIVGGAGDGELCRFTNAMATTNDVGDGYYIMNTDTTAVNAYAAGAALTATSGGAYSKCQWLQPGIRVNIVLASEFDGTMNTADLYGTFEIDAVDYEDNTFALKNVSGSTIDVSADLTAVEYVVVLENAYGQIEADGSTTADSCLELNGLYNLVDDGTNYSTIWGLTRSTHPHALKSTFKAAAGAELDEELLMDWVLDLVNIKQSVPNVLVTDPKSRLKYFSNRKEDRRFDMKTMDSMFGFKSIGVVIDQYSLLLQSLTSLQPGSLFMLNTNDFKFAKATNGFEWIEDGGRVLRNMEGSDNLFGTAVNYCEFICENPNGQLKATGLSY